MKPITYLALFVLACLTPFLHAHETEEKTPAPGFRPETEHAAAFLNSVGSCNIVVYPTVVRIKTPDTVVVSQNNASQKAILDHLIEKKIIDPNGLDLSRIEGRGQFDFFQSCIKQMGQQIQKPYHLAAEVIILQRPDNQIAVWGIHVYILDPAGQNAFSFLLNSHHQILVDAKLFSKINSKEAIDKLVAQSTKVALKALDAQIHQAK
jgi:hypothetical protein